MSSTTTDDSLNEHISSATPSCEFRSDSKGCDSSRSTQKRQPLSWGDMSPGARWDLIEPLSKLTKDMTDVPIIDIDIWVRRSVEERTQETGRKGKVMRPMNSFMLYRWAYTERIKTCSGECSHQVVSSIAGKSWHMEPQNVQERYRTLAKVERNCHASAYPNYKFKPKSRKRSSEAEPTADIQGYGLSENNANEWSSIHGFQTTTPRPINDLFLGLYAETTQDYVAVALEDCFEEGNSSGLFGIPGSGYHDLMCPDPIEFYPASCPNGDYGCLQVASKHMACFKF
ncbi:unnamed protein product [Penicillium salamii]|nr:unnamed protein product [Penicillium salamii]CAG8296858.1 unnamed protein product [Penicillium salamii]